VTDEVFVGRSWELLLVDHLLSELRDGRGRLLLITGPPGIGKTRLVTELLARASTSAGWVRDIAADGDGGLWQRLLDVLSPATVRAIQAARNFAPALHLLTHETWERTGLPVVAAIDAIDRAAPSDLSVVDDLLPALDGLPLLLVLTASSPGDPAAPWQRWRHHGNATHLELLPLAELATLELVGAHLPGAGRETVESVAAACRGNPGIARELCQWTQRGSGPAPWLSAAVAGAGEVLAALGVIGEPVTACLMAKVTGLPRDRVVAALKTARAAGLVSCDEKLDPRYRLALPLIGDITQALAGPQRTAQLNRQFARVLADEEPPAATSIRIARHLLAAGERGTQAVRHYLDATRWLAGSGSHQAALELATQGLASAPAGEQECRLFLLAGRCAAKSGDVPAGRAHLRNALARAEALPDRELFAHAVADLAEATPIPATETGLAELVAQALQACPPDALAVRARVEAARARLLIDKDAVAAGAAGGRALALAQESGDLEAIRQAVRVRLLPGTPHQIADYARIGAELSQLPGAAAAGGIYALGYWATATGRRAVLDCAIDRFASLPLTDGDVDEQLYLLHLRAARAILDTDRTGLVGQLRELIVRNPDAASILVPTASMVWRAHTDRELPRDVRQAAMPGTPLGAEFAALPRAANWVLAAGYQNPVPHRVSRQVMRMPDPTRLPLNVFWSTWQAISARAGALVGSVERCRVAVEQLGPFVDQFVMSGMGLPMGPVGWFLADAQCLLGELEQALDANARAQRLSGALASPGWVVRCRLQRGWLLRDADRAAATAALTEARDGARTLNMTRVVMQSRQLLDELAVGPDRTGPSLADGGLVPEHIEILQHAASGMTNAEIAKSMHLSVPTVERRFRDIYRRLGVRNRAQAVSLAATRHGRW
jgi:DNA-binding CsgD family transcriptional regulator